MAQFASRAEYFTSRGKIVPLALSLFTRFRAWRLSEKVIYFLLLDRKARKPCFEDDAEVMVRSRAPDPPRKRVDAHAVPSANGFAASYSSQLSQGSPVTPRRMQLYSPCPRRKELEALAGSIRSVG